MVTLAGVLAGIMALPGTTPAQGSVQVDVSKPLRIDVTLSGAGAIDSVATALTDDGSVIALGSNANDLVAGDTNGAPDGFVWVAGKGVRRVTVGVDGKQFPHGSGGPVVDGAGTTAWFNSPDNPQYTSVLRHSLVRSGPSTLVPVVPPGFTDRIDFVLTRAASRDGRVLLSQLSRDDGYYLSSVVTVNGRSFVPDASANTDPVAVAADGGVVVIQNRDKIVNGLEWVDLAHGNRLRRLRLPGRCALSGYDGVSVSADGHAITVGCNLGSAPGVWEFDTVAGAGHLVWAVDDVRLDGRSADGRFLLVETDVALTGADHNAAFDLYLVDLTTGITHLVTKDANGQARGVWAAHEAFLSADGSTIAFTASPDLDPAHPGGRQGTYVVHITGR